jgi:hypothetical protein
MIMSRHEWCKRCIHCPPPCSHPLSWRAGHFRNEHFACDHPHCLEARFVVFSNEQELKQHRLREHNEQLSRNERRAALQIPVNLTVCTREMAIQKTGHRLHIHHICS